MSQEQRQIAFRALVLALLLIVGDQCILRFCDFLAKSPTWGDGLMSKMVDRQQTEPPVLIIGTCRAALHFDSKIMAESLGVPVFNAGRVVDGLGNIDLTWRIAKHQQNLPHTLILVLDDSIWIQSDQERRDDLLRHEREWTRMSQADQSAVAKIYNVHPILNYSGFWKYRGSGEALVRVILRRPQSLDQFLPDGYHPRDRNQNFASAVNDPAQLQLLTEQQTKSIKFDQTAINIVEGIVKSARDLNVPVILVNSPMHRLRGTDQVVQQQVELATNIAGKFNVKLFNYLDNTSDLSNRSELWSDAGHLNQSGAEIFTKDFVSAVRPEIKGANK